MTTWWPLAPTATTRSSDGMPSGGPASMRAWPVRAAAWACAGGSIGTSRSAPGDTSVIRPWASSTWMVSVPGATGTGLGSRFWSMSAATVTAPCRAESSSPLDEGHPQGIGQQHRRGGEGERQPGRGDQGQPGAQAAPPPPAGGPASLGGHGQPPSAASR